MSIKKIKDDANGVYIITDSREPVEYVSFSEYRRQRYITNSLAVCTELLKRNPKFSGLPNGIIQSVAFQVGIQGWDELEAEIRSVKVPNALRWVLSAPKKRQQEQQLKKCSFNTEEFAAFLFYAEDGEYTYSQYIAEHPPRNFNKDDLPLVVDDNVEPVRIVGKTNLTEGQLKKFIADRSVVVSTFLDKGAEWHCFFATYESLKGEENWQGGQPHFHYLSDKFGISRDEAVKQLTSRQYNLGSLPHLKILNYGE